MIPLIQLFSLIIKVFTRPAIDLTQRFYNRNDIQKTGRAYGIFIWLGKKYHQMDTIINIQKSKLAKENFIAKQLTNQKQALNKGIDFFFEIVFYFLILTVPGYQIYIGHKETLEKNAQMEKRLSSMETRIIQSRKANRDLLTAIGQVQNLHEQMTEEIFNAFEKSANEKQIYHTNQFWKTKKDRDMVAQAIDEIQFISQLKLKALNNQTQMKGILDSFESFLNANTLLDVFKIHESLTQTVIIEDPNQFLSIAADVITDQEYKMN